ncbi:MAG: SDR family oxidoreductase [Thermomicrobiales bacterium]|nr:SDR family oxidoreductase [Thermomicrobiales bacterium]
MSEPQSLRGKVALVTGAGSGLGEAVARAFGNAHCAVACIDLDEDRAARVAADLGKGDIEALAIGCDVSDPASVNAAVGQARARWGRIDIAVNCAGYDIVKSVSELSVVEWDRILGVNLRGPFLVAKAVMPTMREQQSGLIVNIASTAGVRAWGNASAYHASKWGVIGFSRGLGVEGRADNIRVTTVIPGGMRTGWFDRFPDQGIPLPDPTNLQDPATVANAIVFAATVPPESSLQELILTPLTETSWP